MTLEVGSRVQDSYGREGVLIRILDGTADIIGYQRVWREPVSSLTELADEPPGTSEISEPG